ncbi:MAG TPA: polysaccharide deacetylase family protein [Ignavibacteriaceae bacterium]|nr:polysaccharide deacetylase family protein [Ignavibacteriaceae bacterium]
MNLIKRISIIFLLLTATINAQSTGSVIVKTWANDKKAAFSLTFDDGYESQYNNARPILNSYGFNGTFFVITGSLVHQGEEKIWRYGTWEEFAEMAAEGHEIAAHTVTHPDLTKINIGDINTAGTAAYEIYQSKIAIEQNVPGDKVISFAYPFTTTNANVRNLAGQYYVDSRVGGNLANNADPSTSDWTRLKSYEVQFNTPRNSTNDDLDELNQAETWVQNAITNGQWGMLFAHEVLPFSQIPDAVARGDWYPMSSEWLNAFCSWLKEKSDNDSLWVETAGNVTKYIKERENFSSTVLVSNDSELRLQVTDGLDNSIYNFPLTVDVVVPAAWDSVDFNQGFNSQKLGAFTVADKKYVRINVIPDGGDVILKNSSSIYYTFYGTVTYDNSSSTPLADVMLKLADQNGNTLSTTTDLYGNFNFQDILPGTYSLTISKSTGWGGVNASDALLSMKYYSNTDTLSELQKKAGDVDNNGIINAADALLIAKRYVNIISSFSIDDWLFDKQNSSVVIKDQNLEENIKALVAGNVTRSYIPQ